MSFDPRLRAGGDYLNGVHVEPHHVSIHASAREATAEGLRPQKARVNGACCANLRGGGDRPGGQAAERGAIS